MGEYAISRKYPVKKKLDALTEENIETLLRNAERVHHTPWSETDSIKPQLAKAIKSRAKFVVLRSGVFTLTYTDNHVHFKPQEGSESFVPRGWLPLHYANTVDL